MARGSRSCRPSRDSYPAMQVRSLKPARSASEESHECPSTAGKSGQEASDIMRYQSLAGANGRLFIDNSSFLSQPLTGRLKPGSCSGLVCIPLSMLKDGLRASNTAGWLKLIAMPCQTDSKRQTAQSYFQAGTIDPIRSDNH